MNTAITSIAGLVLGASIVLGSQACERAPANAPNLDAVLSRVDVPRLLDCAKSLPDYKAAAICLGAEAATQGLQVALDQALVLAERARAASGQAGAADLSDEERAAIGRDLDAALDRLGAEIDATHAAG